MKCLICEKEIEDKNGDLCQTCKEFFLSQNKNDLKKIVGRFQESHDYLEEWRSQSDKKEVEE